MNELAFCMEAMAREEEKFKLTFNATTISHITADTSDSVNYDNAINRCSYMYRYGAINLCFAKECFTNFFSDFKNIFLLSKWNSHSNLSLCSLSNGPALDYIAFFSSYQKFGPFPSFFKDIKVISKHGAWRNTVNIMHQAVAEGLLRNLPSTDLGKIDVIQGDPFKELTQKVEEPISNADVLIMVKKLNYKSENDINNPVIINSVQVFLTALKPNAILFCIDTKPSVTLLSNAISCFNGTYLLKPTLISTLIELDLKDAYQTIFGCPPVISARGTFFVWQKSALLDKISVSGQLWPLAICRAQEEQEEKLKQQLLKTYTNNSSCDKTSDINSGEKFVADSSHSSISTHLSTVVENYNGPKANFIEMELENGELSSTDSMNISAQNLNNISSSSSQNNDFTFCEKENVLIKDFTFKNISIDKSTQTEPERSAESLKMASLTEKVVNLTATIKNLLKKSQVKDVCDNHCDDCLQKTEQIDNASDNCDCSSTYSSQVSCLHEYHCGCLKNALCNSLQEKNCRNYSSCGMCKQGCLRYNKLNSDLLSDCNGETTKCNNTQYKELQISAENKPVPKLVIPLTNLSGDVVTQIISLITPSILNNR